jgi:hypothetical protein
MTNKVNKSKVNKSNEVVVHNTVAKHCRTFCKSSVQRDRKNDYNRKDKHKQF